MVKNKSDIIQVIQKHTSDIDRFGVRTIRLFGSYAKGLQTNESDVDVIVEFSPNQKSFDNFMGVAALLEELFQRRVELITPESLSERMKRIVLDTSEYVFRRN